MGWGEVREHDAVRGQLARDLAAERARADAAEAECRRLRREMAGLRERAGMRWTRRRALP